MAYDDRGPEHATPVLCLPSLGDTRAQMRRLTPGLLDAGLRALTADLRGQGESDTTFTSHQVSDLAGDAIAILDDAKIDRAVLVGSSIAGAAAILAAARHPDRVRGLVLLGPVARDLPLGRLLRPLWRPVFGGPWGPALWSAYYRSLFKRERPADLDAHVETLRSMLRRPAHRRALVELLRSDRAEVMAEIGRATAPAAIVMGSADPDFPDPRAEVRWLEGALGQVVSTTVLEGVGHYPHLEAPDAVVAAVRTVIASERSESEVRA